MTIEIKTEKVRIGNNAGRKVLKISGILKENELPREYFIDCSHCFLNDEHELEIIGRRIDYSILKEGEIYDESYFQNMLSDIIESGKRLHIINKDLPNASDEWHGMKTIKI